MLQFSLLRWEEGDACLTVKCVRDLSELKHLTVRQASPSSHQSRPPEGAQLAISAVPSSQPEIRAGGGQKLPSRDSGPGLLRDPNT